MSDAAASCAPISTAPLSMPGSASPATRRSGVSARLCARGARACARRCSPCCRATSPAGASSTPAAAVVAIDLSPEMVRFAAETLPRDIGPGAIEFHAGDMLAEKHGRFDAVMAMDSLIHYRCADAVEALTGLAARTDRAIVFTFAPRTLPLAAMHMAGRLFPRGDRAPSIEPVAEATLRRALAAEHGLGVWIADRTARVSTGFYTSQVMELTRR
jgi:magnesium-protoporphyrin O-methyltransferase